MNNHMPPPAHPTTRPTRHGRGVRPLLTLAAVACLAALLLLAAACRSADLGLTPLPGAEVRAGEQVAFVAATTPLAVVATSSGYVPDAFGSPLDPTPTPTPSPTPPTTLGPPLPPPTVVVAIPPIDFDAARASAEAKGLDIAFTKIGFHVAVGGNANGIGDYHRKLNAAGVPIFLKSANAGGPLYEVQQMMKANEAAGRDVPHTLVFRLTHERFEAPYYDLSLSPEEAAAVSWELNRDNFPRELDKKYIWYETLNEPGRYGYDGNLQIERLGRFSLETAKLALSQGYRYAALSWSTGVPEPEDWEDPAMLDFLRFAGEHPDQVAVALHEYSLIAEDVAAGYPYLLGRFQSLFEICDKHGIPRPTILITEWGWTYDDVPEPELALEHIAWASWLYAAYPTIKGAAIWYLGPGGSIADKTQRLIAPLGDYATSHYFVIDPGIGQIDPTLFYPPWRSTIKGILPGPTPFPRPRFVP